ncbi:Bug family tripartite tricarboxylate transporter substrate binding protein [Plastoroseomonas arctica]|uniref:Tripartite tricarboxylate transporter substrate binding protein n=1 Tax=Plastoroseomonas arctica TaxID=1509237 RepID=A0AAF1K5X0_9PROT|nr:tripartite tricarboxylate transporter substrate-binding protein [Plastoroseomonas arctica]MBR0657050.1 tripartite tricarboxylate transporter substrate binding protein [Plastoroseomonas arctica]
MIRRIALLAIAALIGGIAAAQAQSYPNRPIRLIVPWPPGQATDLAGRVIAQRLSEVLGQAVIAENRAGAGGMIGTDTVAKAAPDGYTLLAASSGPYTINPLVQRTPYETERDFAAVALVGVSPYVLVANPAFPATTLPEFVAALRARPGHYTFGSSGTGATAHLIIEWFNSALGIRAEHIPFQGSAPSLTAVVAGQVDYSIETLAATQPLIRGNSLRPFGISFARGSTLAPGIPGIATDAPIPGFDVGAWIGLVAPAATPRSILDIVEAATLRGMDSNDARERVAGIGIEMDLRGSAAFTTYLREQTANFRRIIETTNIRLNN